MQYHIDEIGVDPEFQQLLPVALPEQTNGLYEDLTATGIRDSLVVWTEKGILLDGHRRLEWARANGIQKLEVVEYGFHTRADAVRWMVLNQANRRNLTRMQISELRGKAFQQRRAAKVVGRGIGHGSGDTDAEVAKEFDVAPSTIGRDSMVATLLARLDKLRPETAMAIRARTVKVRKSDIERLYAEEDDEQMLAELDALTSRTKEPEIVQDETTRQVPERLYETFATRKIFTQIIKHLVPHLQDGLTQIGDVLYGTRDARKIPAQGLKINAHLAALDAIVADCEAHKPRLVCPRCLANSKSCPICRGKGWLSTCPKKEKNNE